MLSHWAMAPDDTRVISTTPEGGDAVSDDGCQPRATSIQRWRPVITLPASSKAFHRSAIVRCGPGCWPPIKGTFIFQYTRNIQNLRCYSNCFHFVIHHVLFLKDDILRITLPHCKIIEDLPKLSIYAGIYRIKRYRLLNTAVCSP